jgi:hypothetical protein
MSIEQKIAEILAEAKIHGSETGAKDVTAHAGAGDKSVVRKGDAVPATSDTDNEANKKNNVDNQHSAEDAPTGTMNPKNGEQSPVRKGSTSVKAGVKEDMDALFNGEELTEEFKEKATTIYEAAVMARVNEEVARIEAEFESKLAEQVEQNTEGLVEKVDGYLGYIAEQWMEQNEIALERGIKSEILESFVAGLKTVFEEHYIEVPEEKFDVLADMEDKVAALEAKLNEQVEANVELSKTIAEAKRAEIVKSISEGLTDTETEKFLGLVEELSYEDAETFETKVKTIRENYFTQKQNTIVESVVTDTPVETLTEEKKVQVDPSMAAYLSALNKI